MIVLGIFIILAAALLIHQQYRFFKEDQRTARRRLDRYTRHH